MEVILILYWSELLFENKVLRRVFDNTETRVMKVIRLGRGGWESHVAVIPVMMNIGDEILVETLKERYNLDRKIIFR